MSMESVRNILIRIATDKDYREGFFKDKDKALSQYTDLTNEERQCFYELTPERIKSAAIKECNKLKHVRDIRI